MLTSLQTLNISSRSTLSLWSTSSTRPLFLSPAFSSPLVNAYDTRSCTSRDETPSNCQNVTNSLLPRESGREGYRNGTRFRPSQRELLSSEPIPADNLFLSGLQSTRVPHEWDFGWIELETSISGWRQWLEVKAQSAFTTIERINKQVEVAR